MDFYTVFFGLLRSFRVFFVIFGRGRSYYETVRNDFTPVDQFQDIFILSPLLAQFPPPPPQPLTASLTPSGPTLIPLFEERGDRDRGPRPDMLGLTFFKGPASESPDIQPQS